MQYVKYNFRLYQGTNDTIVLRLYSVDTDKNTTDIDLRGSGFVMSIKNNKNGVLIDQLSTDSNNGRIVLGNLNDSKVFTAVDTTIDNDTSVNSIKLVFPSDITKDYIYPTLYYDLFRVVEDNSEVIMYGEIQVLRSISDV